MRRLASTRLRRSPAFPESRFKDVTRIARQAVFDQALPLEIVGVLLSGPGSGYVEILVNLDDCAGDPCQFLMACSVTFRRAP